MDLSQIFSHPFHTKAQQFNEQIKNSKWKLTHIRLYPFTRYIIEGDDFFKSVWSIIDSSQKYFWINTYAMDSSPAADTTLLKMIAAAKRGVHVVLFIDNVQYWAKKSLVEELKKAGGKHMVLNPQFQLRSIPKYYTKDVWRRHHEKVIVSDEKAIIGSSNIEGNYAGMNYGNSNFRDINFYSENIILDEYRKHFIDTANFYSFDLKSGEESESPVAETNEKIQNGFDQLYPNSQFYPKGKYKLLHNDQARKLREIQESVLEHIKKSKKQIKIVQPYHFQILKSDRLLLQAHKRGINLEIITSGQRDQPVFKLFKNLMIFYRLQRQGVKVFETRERLLHSKVYFFDGKWINLGSMNNDRWSWKINNECNILIEDERHYQEVLHYYKNLKQTCHPVVEKESIQLDNAGMIQFWQWFLYASEIVMSKSGKPEEDYIETEPGFKLDDDE